MFQSTRLPVSVGAHLRGIPRPDYIPTIEAIIVQGSSKHTIKGTLKGTTGNATTSVKEQGLQ